MELAELKRPFLDEINQIRFVSHQNKLFCHSFIVWSEKNTVLFLSNGIMFRLHTSFPTNLSWHGSTQYFPSQKRGRLPTAGFPLLHGPRK
jgi:hypothetical protein